MTFRRDKIRYTGMIFLSDNSVATELVEIIALASACFQAILIFAR